MKPKGGRKYVFLQIKRPGTKKWVTMQRQTTTATGVYDFGTYSRAEQRKYKNRFYNIRTGSRHQQRVLVRGDAKYKALKSLTYTVQWGS